MTANRDIESVLSIADLQTHFFTDHGVVRAVDGVSLEVPRGKTLALVGESGSGKSVTAFSVLRLVASPGQIVGGRITLHGRNGESRAHSGDIELTSLDPESRAMREIRGNRIALVFQEPMSSFSPVHTIGSQIMEAIRLHQNVDRAEGRRHTVDIMKRVGIPDPDRRFSQYPHEMSGGLRQRAMIAMALSCRPELLIADEPTTALDVTMQAQILDLLRDLVAELDMSVLLITHDLGVVAEIADEVAVMYLGRVVEQADVATIFRQPRHPYTEALLQSMPSMHTERQAALPVIEGSVPDGFERVPGCGFHPRCTVMVDGLCNTGEAPELRAVDTGHLHACRARHAEGAEDMQQ